MKKMFHASPRPGMLLMVCAIALLSSQISYAVNNIANGIYYNRTSITAKNSGNTNQYSYTGIVDLSGSSWTTTIASYAFLNCYVTNVRIPSNISYIEKQAFYGCERLKRVLLESSSCDFQYYTSGYRPFDQTSCVMYVPEGTGDYYRSKTLGGNVTIVDGFTSSGQSYSGSGAGTREDPFLIFNPIQLNQVRNFLDEKWVHFKLMSDIDLTGWIADNNPSQGWQPIGTESSPFMGVFDGNNHKISGLRINRSTTDDVGFFGYMLWAGVSNLTIEDSGIIGNKYVGTLSGRAVSCDIHNCVVSGTLIAGSDYSGGLIGCASGNVADCVSSVNVSGNNIIGGFIGAAFGGQGAELHLDDCKSEGIVNGNGYLSLVVGKNSRYMFITSMKSSGRVSSNGSNIGGIVGFSSGGKLEINDCSVYCDLNCTADNVGGIIGNSEDSVIYINKSFSIGDIVSNGSYAGGIAGYVLTKGTISDTYYNGNITSSGEYIGGIAGFAKNTTIRKCYSYANLIGDSYVGGIAGYAPGSTIKSNVSICGLVSAVSGNVGRIYGCDDLNDITLGENGTANENKGLATASVLLNGVVQDLPDGLKHGTNVGNATLKLKATYQGMGWDFDDWTIVETESYPFKFIQCAPPVITSILEAKATEVSGNSVDGGTVNLVTGGHEYTAQTSGNNWTVQVAPLQAGAVVKAQADTEDKLPSYFELKTVGFGGNGTEEDPYSIYTAEDLQSINSYSYYKLMTDIDLSEWINENNPSGGWVPIGASGNATMKQLDGNGHKITGLWCDNDMENCGLFATTNNATIRDLTISIANGKKVKGGTNTGALVGYAEATQLDGITVYGDIQGRENVGGIVGYGTYDSNDQDFVLKKTAMNGNVTGNYRVGGLVGQSGGMISECYSQGTISSTNETCYVGGIVGYNRFLVENCYSNANVNAGTKSSNSSNQFAGGIVGDNAHTVLHCYATGDLFAVKCAAGIAGYNTSTAAVVQQCYAMNRKIEVADASGIGMRVIGGIRNGAPTPEANNYALNNMVVSVNNIPQTIYDDLLHGQSLTEAVLKKETTYRDNGWDMDNIWNINEDESYPYLRSVEIQNDIEPDIVRGDANGDGDVTITDVVLTAQVAVGKTPNTFIEANADVNGDGNINITDVVIIANIAVGKITMTKKAPVIDCDDSNQLSASNLNIKPGETQTIEIMLDNIRDFCGFQMDIELPEGIELVDAHLSNRADNHDLLIGGEQTLKHLLAFSLGNNVFNGSTGTLLTLTLIANQDFNSSMVPNLSNILFVEPDGNTHQLNDMVISNSQTFVNEVTDANVRIIGEINMIIIDSPVNGKAQVVSTSGVSQWVDIHAGHNEIRIQHGVYVVRMGNKVVKLKI